MLAREVLKKLRKIEILTARLANEQLAGGYHSVFKGRGMAFSEVREYQPGDDVRFIDWNVSARMSETYVKVFTEEREMTVMLLVDLSASGQFGLGGRRKIETAAEVAALIAFSAIKNNDRVGLILFTDRIERFVPPKKGKGHVMRVISEILNARPEGTGTNLTAALDMLGSIAKRRATAFVISDFITRDYEPRLRVMARKHDVIPIQVSDPMENELPNVGLALMRDLETGALLEVDTSDKRVRNEYALAVSREAAQRDLMFRRLRLDSVPIETNKDYVRPLVELFRRRQKRQGGFR